MNHLTSLAFLAALAGATTFTYGASPQTTSSNDAGIAPQSLADALNAFARQKGLKLIYASDLAINRRSNGAPPGLPAAETLQRILSGTGLTAKWLNERTISIRSVGDDNSDYREVGEMPALPNVGEQAQSDVVKDDQETRSTDKSGPTSSVSSERPEDKVELNEVVVTGSHIVGAQSASPIMVFTAEDIARTGYTTVTQFLTALPQNSGGGATELSANAEAISSNLNIPGDTSANIHGLGSGATLTLLNGQRLSSAGDGTYTDISMIPLSAIQRIEVLTDGASALYGSDAVGGVVNVILKDHLSGAETLADYGAVTNGAHRSTRLSQSFGTDWRGGSGLVVYDYTQQSRLSSADRSFTPAATNGSDLIPESTQQSAFATARQAIGSAWTSYSSALFSHKSLETINALQAGLSNAVDQYFVSGGVRYNFGSTWTVDVSGSWSKYRLSEVFSYGAAIDKTTTNSNTWSGSIVANGDLFEIGQAGDTKLAVGGEYRGDALRRYDDTYGTQSTNDGRRVSAGFAELNVPLIGGNSVPILLREITFSSAVRTEHYSDFGDTTNTKFGVRWKPLDSILIRGTTGTAFRAPPLLFIGYPSQALIYPLTDPVAPSGSTTALVLLGAKQNLEPETARTSTIGLDFQPIELPSLKASITLFRTDYKRRLQAPATDFTGMLTNASDFYSLIQRNPTQQAVSNAIANSTLFDNPYDLPISSVAAIVDDRLQNISAVDVRGWDSELSYAKDSSFGVFGADLNAEHIARYSQALTPTSPEANIVNTVYNPPHWRLRGSTNWSLSGLSVSTAINYVGNYANNAVLPAQPVSSFTTVDMRVAYDFGPVHRSVTDGLELAVSAVNIFDKQPPIISGSIAGYDATNANPLGRLIIGHVRKRW
jgi:iron complex outermembrane receptor protein